MEYNITEERFERMICNEMLAKNLVEYAKQLREKGISPTLESLECILRGCGYEPGGDRDPA